MPYKTNDDLPPAVKDNLPKGAQDVYRAAYNYADSKSDTFKDDSERSQYAWGAVKRVYEKDKDGKWVKKDTKMSAQLAEGTIVVTVGLSDPNLVWNRPDGDQVVKVSGTLISEGTWTGLDGHTIYYPRTVFQEAAQTAIAGALKGGHIDDQDAVCGFITATAFDTDRIRFEGIVYDDQAASALLEGRITGVSMEAEVKAHWDEGKQVYVADYINIVRAAFVMKPACAVCKVDIVMPHTEPAMTHMPKEDDDDEDEHKMKMEQGTPLINATMTTQSIPISTTLSITPSVTNTIVDNTYVQPFTTSTPYTTDGTITIPYIQPYTAPIVYEPKLSDEIIKKLKDEIIQALEPVLVKNGELKMADDIVKLQADLEAMKAQLAAKDTELQGKVAELSTVQTTLQSKDVELKTALEAKETELKTIQTNLGAKDAELVQIKAQAEAAKTAKINSLMADIKAKDRNFDEKTLLGGVECPDAKTKMLENYLASLNRQEVTRIVVQDANGFESRLDKVLLEMGIKDVKRFVEEK